MNRFQPSFTTIFVRRARILLPLFAAVMASQAMAQIVTQPPAGLLGSPAGDVTISVSAPAAMAFQWEKSTDGGSNYANVAGNASATTASLSLTNLQPSDTAHYRVQVTDAGSMVTRSSATRLVVLTAAYTTPTPQVNFAFRSPTRGGITVTGAAAIGSSGSVWNNLTGAALSSTLQSQDLLINAALVSDSGAASSVALTLNATSPTQTMSSVVKAFNDGTSFPTVTPVMNYYTYYWWNSTVTLTLTGLRPGASYELYGYGTGNANNQGSSWAMSADNGGASQNCLADFNNGYTRDVTNTNNLGHSYVKLTGMASAAGTMTVVVDNSPSGAADPYFNGFQIKEASDTTITAQPTSTATTLGASATLAVTATAAQAFLWQKSTDNGGTWTSIDSATNTTATTSALILTNCQSSDAALYRVLALNATGGLVISSNAALTVVPNTGSTADTALNVAFRVSNQSGAPAVTGAAAAGSAGSVWNNVIGAAPSSSVLTQDLVSSAALLDDTGAATGKTMTLNATASSNSVAASQRFWSNNSAFSPTPIMHYYSYWWWNASLTVTVNGLQPNGLYHLYGYGTGDAAGQGSKWIVNAANGGASAESPADFGSGYTRDVTNPANLNHSYVQLAFTASSSGTLSFVVDNATGQNDPFFSGFQIVPQAMPTITAQPPANSNATLSGSFSLGVIASGPGTLTYQWQKSIDGGSTFANISSAANASAITATLSISNVQVGDAGTYRVLVSNAAGTVVSSSAAITTSSGMVAPTIQTPPADTTVVAGTTATLTVAASGTSPLGYRWEKSINGGSSYGHVGADSPSLVITGTTLADAGLYRVTITNSVGSITSSAATLTIQQAPVITTQPVGGLFTSGASTTLTVAFDANPAPAYAWQRSTNGSTFTTVGTASSLPLTVTGATSGVYRVVLTNSIGSATSSTIYLGATTTETPAFGPINNATAVNPDAPLIINFAAAPQVGISGKIRVRKVSDDSIAETVDLATLTPYTSGPTTYRVLSRRVGGTNGDTYNSFPVVIVGHQARITLTSGTLLYNTSYYVTIEAGAILDSTGASLPAITDSTTWRFTTKIAAPASVPAQTTFTVNGDGSGDFSTVQGALDHIPTGNTTPVRINVADGIYHELINYGSRHHITLAGASRSGVIVQYLNNAVFNGPIWVRPSFYAKGSDLTLYNLTIQNTTPQGGGQAEALRTDGSRIQIVSCDIKSHQDTLLLGNSTYFFDCLIQGDADYIWGGGNAMFKNCELRAMGGGELTQARTPLTRFGFIFVDCSLTRHSTSLTAYGLGRTSAGLTDYGNVAYINCKMDAHITPAGWSNAFINPTYTANARNWEYQSTAPDGTTLIDISSRTHGSQLNSAQALILRDPANVFGTTTDGTPAGAQGGGWVPNLAPVISTQPAAQTVNPTQIATFSVTASALLPLSYQWYHNGSPISGATGSSHSIPSATAADWGTYTVLITNLGGNTTSSTVQLTINDPVALWANSNGLDPATSGLSTADPDGDGLNNLLEFAFGMSPSSSSTGTFALSGNILTQTGQPTVQASGTITARFVRRKTHTTDGLIYTPQFSPDLTTWENSTATPVVIASDATHEVVELPYPDLVAGQPARFFRIALTQTP